MTNCRLIVCEKTAHFAPAVRRELATSRSLVVETRSIARCEAELAESPESLVAIEVTAINLQAVIDFLVHLGRRYPRAAVAGLLSDDSLAVEALIAEAGAIAVFRSVLDAPALARLAERKTATASPSDLSLPEFVAERLPWPAHGKN